MEAGWRSAHGFSGPTKRRGALMAAIAHYIAQTVHCRRTGSRSGGYM